MDLKDSLRLYDAQAAIIGSMLISPEIIGEVLSECREEDFSDGTLRNVYRAIQKLFFENVPVDAVTVLAELGDSYRQTLMDVMMATPTAAHWKAYSTVLRELAALRRVQELAAQLVETATMESAAELVEKLSFQFCQRPGIRVVPILEGLSEFYDRHSERAGKINYLMWGYGAMNERLYVEAGDYVVLGGRPSAGKTMLACSFALAQAIHGRKRVGIFSFETSDKKLYDRIFSRVAGVDFSEIKRSALTAESWSKIGEIPETIEGVHFDVIDASGMSAQDIRATALGRRFEVVYVDYLQLIKISNRNNRAEQVAEISRSLQSLARSAGITVVALSQLSRPQKSDRNKPPTLEDLRESGQIEQDADVVMLLYSKDVDIPESDRGLFIAKNKDGSLGRLTFAFEPTLMRFTPRAGRIDEPPERPRGRSKAPEERKKFIPVYDNTPIEEVFNGHSEDGGAGAIGGSQVQGSGQVSRYS